jgi:alpha-1,3-rhamnosyl/mannosyltransferase
MVLTVHDVIPLAGGAYHSRWVRRYLAGLMRASIGRAAAIMADSAVTAQHLMDILRVPERRISVVPIGVDQVRFRPASGDELARVRATYALSEPYVIAVGTVEPRKNLVRLVRAFAQAHRTHYLPQQLVIVGKPGWAYDEVAAAVAATDLGPAIRLLGYLPREDVAPLISGADLLAYVSLEEGFGLPVAEGMACGAAVLASAASSVAEVAGDAAILVEPTDEDAIAAALARLCLDAELRERLSAAGLVRGRGYTWERVARAAIASYRSVAAAPSVR